MKWVNNVEWDEVHNNGERFWTASDGDLDANLWLDPNSHQWWVLIDKTGAPEAELCCGLDEQQALQQASRYVKRTLEIERSRSERGYGY